VQVSLPSDRLVDYKSKSQRARIATEAWGEANLYCPHCESPRLWPTRVNTPAVDYQCPDCKSLFQLKAQSRAFSGRIVDAAYSSMVRAVRENRTPNLFALHYEPLAWKVANLLLIPQFAFPLSAVEKRPPLGPNARRAGWVGCNILLHAIPPEARIAVIVDGKAFPKNVVRQQYARMRPLATLQADQRGWTLDVLNAIRSLDKPNFSLSDAYGAEGHLTRLHPTNKHVRDKIRQQLQVLRDLGLLDFLGQGHYRLRQVPA
jgi:type II restriction enzyme